MHKIVLLGSFLLMIIIAVGQVPPDSVEQYLNQKAKDYTALTSRLEISVSEVSLDEFLRAIAVANKLNFDIADNLDDVVVNNFSGVMVKDMLAFICKQYNLTLEFTGNIISIRKSPTVKNRYTPKQSEMSFDTEKNTITFNFKNDSLVLVAEQITRLTQSNVVLAPTLSQKMVTCYIQDKPIENALDK
ncbi:MAG TPA: hypothetical protein DEQ03_04075, partial [Marinilabiliales bacterium]|nr:hypothetical protein [Marinilabiliales bacterium]